MHPGRAYLFEKLLESENICLIDFPGLHHRLSDLNHIKHVWDFLLGGQQEIVFCLPEPVRVLKSVTGGVKITATGTHKLFIFQ